MLTRNGGGCHYELEDKVAGKISRILEWIGRAETINGLVQTELVRTWLTPAVLTMITGSAGYLGNIPAMWIIMASSLTFGGVSTGMLSASAYKERKSPQNKLRYQGTIFNFELVPIRKDRAQRRANASAERKVTPPADYKPVIRELSLGQLGVELYNSASFPISVILEMADSGIERMTPPRTKYPKTSVTVFPGVPIRMLDEKISLDKLQCGRIEGKLYMIIKYGLPGKEIYKLDIRIRKIDIMIQSNGFYSGNVTEWES